MHVPCLTLPEQLVCDKQLLPLPLLPFSFPISFFLSILSSLLFLSSFPSFFMYIWCCFLLFPQIPTCLNWSINSLLLESTFLIGTAREEVERWSFLCTVVTYQRCDNWTYGNINLHLGSSGVGVGGGGRDIGEWLHPNQQSMVPRFLWLNNQNIINWIICWERRQIVKSAILFHCRRKISIPTSALDELL